MKMMVLRIVVWLSFVAPCPDFGGIAGVSTDCFCCQNTPPVDGGARYGYHCVCCVNDLDAVAQENWDIVGVNQLADAVQVVSVV